MLDIYRSAIAPVLFYGLKADPEFLHHKTMQVLGWLDRPDSRPTSSWIQAQFRNICCLSDSRLQQTLWGVNFSNPVGLAAGFDKDGIASTVWGNFGFGFAELGTVTLHSQPGNPRPRLFRLPDDRAVLNRMGFNNQGAAAMAARLGENSKRLQDGEAFSGCPSIALGVNLGKSKVTALEASPEDYRGSFSLLKDLGDYFVVNVSSPNTPGLRSLQDAGQLAAILQALQEENLAVKPILVKIAPDLEWEAISQVIEVAKSYRLAGIIATNTTISRDNLKTKYISQTGNFVKDEAGGISGVPLRQRSTEIVRFIYQQTRGEMTIVGSGGIFDAEDAWEKIVAGASLVQVYTGLVYEGPVMVRRILEGLLQKLQERGLSHISEAVGLEA